MANNPKSLGLFASDSFPRAQCLQLVQSKHFNNLILVSIIVNCLMMVVLYDPLDTAKFEDVRDISDILFTFLFTFELFAKIIAYGFAFGPEAYLKNGWNVLDGIVVIISIVCLDFVSGGIDGVNSMRVIRSVRPLRTLSRFKSGALFVNTIFSSWNYICNVLVFLVWFIILAACAGTVLFRGQLRSRCYDLGATAVAAAGGNPKAAACPGADELLAGYFPAVDVSGEYIICGLERQNCPIGHTCCDDGENAVGDFYRFDNALWSSLLVLQGLTVDGWNEVCYALMEGLGWPVLLWYSLVVFCGAFFVMQLLDAVIVSSFQKCSAEAQLSDKLNAERLKRKDLRGARRGRGGADAEDEDQGADAQALNAVSSAWESPAMGPVRRVLRLHIPKLYEFAESDGFNNAILGCIVVNTVVMMTRHYPESDEFASVLSIINYVFTGVFILEFVIKHLGYGLAGYWSMGWNQLDGVVVISSIFDLAGSAVNLGFLRALRVLRVVRSVRVLKVAPEAMAVMNSMVVALGSMGGFLLVWFIFMLIYALFGMRLFGGACITLTDPDAGRFSFNSFARSMLTLFITGSGENGFDVIHWTMEEKGVSASVFMISWMFISQIILSLLLALLIDAYSVDGEEDEEGSKSNKDVELRRDILDMEEEEEERRSMDLSRSASHHGDGARSNTTRAMSEDFNKYVTEQNNYQQHQQNGGVNTTGQELLNTERTLMQSLAKKTMEAGDDAVQQRYKKRLDLLQALQRHRMRQEVAVIRQWLYDIDFDTEKLVANALPLPLRMTATQEQNAKDRLSIKKHYNRVKTGNDSNFEGIAFDPLSPGHDPLKGGKSLKGESSEKDSESRVPKKTLKQPAGSEDVDVQPEPTFWSKVANDGKFVNTILVAIIVSSLTLALETPTWPEEGTAAGDAFFGIDIFFTVVFTVEMTVQFLALGVFGYFRSGANKLDFTIVFTAWLSIFMNVFAKDVDASALSVLRSFRLLRVLRPLRAVRRLPSLRMVVDCTVNSLPAIKWIMVLGMFLALILGLFGMELFGGKFWSCQFPPAVAEAWDSYQTEAACVAARGVWANRTLTECERKLAVEEMGDPFLSAASPVILTECTMPEIVTKQDCLEYNGTWANQEYHFDSIGQSLVVVFISSTADNWQDIMFTGIDSVGQGKNLKYDHSLVNAIYFVVITMLSCFFWANMFVSTLVDQYTKASENEGVIALAEKSGTMSKAILMSKQQAAAATHWASRKVDNPITAGFIRIAIQPWFQTGMLGVIFLNGVMLMIIHADQPAWMDLLDTISSIIFQTIYCIEVVILMVAMTPRAYLYDPWNRFDFLIVTVGLLELSIPGDHGFIAVLRTFRFLRLFKIVKGLKELRTLLYTIISALPGVSNIGLLLFILMFMYACLGVTLYGDIGEPYGSPSGLNKYTNFRSWPNAMLTLFVIFTGNWESIFRATYWDCEGGVEDWGLECTYRFSAPFFFFSYYLLANCVLSNLFVSIILDKFTTAQADEDDDGADFAQVVHQAFMLKQFTNMLSRKVGIFQMLSGRVKAKKLEHHRALYKGLVGEKACFVSEEEAKSLVGDIRGIKKYFDSAELRGTTHLYEDAEDTHGANYKKGRRRSSRSAYELKHGDGGGRERGLRGGEMGELTSFRSYTVVHESELQEEDGPLASMMPDAGGVGTHEKKARRDSVSDADAGLGFERKTRSYRSGSEASSRRSSRSGNPRRSDWSRRDGEERSKSSRRERRPPVIIEDADSDDSMDAEGGIFGNGGGAGGSWFDFSCQWIPSDVCGATPQPKRRSIEDFD